MTTFYAKDGLEFTKLSNGDVEIRLPAITAVILDCDTWASAVAAMSAEGDTAQGFEIARGFHLQGLKRVRFEPPVAI